MLFHLCHNLVVSLIHLDRIEQVGKAVFSKTDVQNRTHNLNHGSCILCHWISTPLWIVQSGPHQVPATISVISWVIAA